MSPKIPPFIFLVFCNRTNVKKSQRVPSFRFFGTMRLLKILIFCFFFAKFFKSRFNFLKFCNRMDVKKISKCPPFTVFGIVTFFKSNNFCLKIRFSQAQHAVSDFLNKDRCFFYATFFSNLFLSKPPQFLLETKLFASIKHCSRFSALCDLPETFIKKFFEKFRFFSSIFCFF